MTDDPSDGPAETRAEEGGNLPDWMTGEECEAILQAVANERKHTALIPELRKIHASLMASDQRDMYRATTLEMVVGELRKMKEEGLFKPEGFEVALAEDLGRWIVADDPERAARIAPKARFWHQAVRGEIGRAHDDGVPVPTALREMAGRLARMLEEAPRKRPGQPPNFGMQFAARILVEKLAELGWPITPARDSDTASDIVAEALGNLKIASDSPERIRKIYVAGRGGLLVKLFEKLRKEGALGENFEAPEYWQGQE